MKKLMLIICTLIFLCPLILYGGIEWQAQVLTKNKDKESKIVMHGYAQKGMVREEYIEVSEEMNQFMEKGMYWLYFSDKNEVYIVDPEEKSYFVMNIDSLMFIENLTVKELSEDLFKIPADYKQVEFNIKMENDNLIKAIHIDLI